MSNFEFDPLLPWLRFRPPPEDLPGFGVRPVDMAPNAVPGLAGWQPPATPMTPPAPDSAPPATAAGAFMPNIGFDPLSPWLSFRPPPEDLPGFRVRPVDMASDGVTWSGWLATDGDGYRSPRAGQRPARRASRIISLVGAVNRPQHGL